MQWSSGYQSSAVCVRLTVGPVLFHRPLLSLEGEPRLLARTVGPGLPHSGPL